MKFHLIAQGKMKSGPTQELFKTYSQRLRPALQLHEIQAEHADLKKRQTLETDKIIAAVESFEYVIALDERGKLMSSPQFANLLAQWRDQGQRDVSFIIGGADGLDPDLRSKASASLSFGKMVWPHMMARLMLSEQLYRSASILAGSPYLRV